MPNLGFLDNSLGTTLPSLSKYSYIELEDEDLEHETYKVSTVQTIIEFQEQKAIYEAKTAVEKQEAKKTSDAIRAVFKVIPLLSSQVKSKADLAKPEAKALIRNKAIQKIRESANEVEPLFAEEIIAEQIKDIDKVIDIAVEKFIENTIAIPRMTVQKEIFQAEYHWFDLDTSLGFDLPALSNEIIRISVGAGEKTVDIIQSEIGRKFDKPINQIVNALIDYDDIDYDQNSELLYHLAQQAIDAISSNLKDKHDLSKIVYEYRKAIANMIYNQMKRHFIMKSTGYVKPKILPFGGIFDQHIKEVEGYGRIDYRNDVPPAHIRKFIYTGYMKSYYTEYKFDSKTELDFSFILENDGKVFKWLRPAKEQFNIYWSNGSRRYEPDFVVETEHYIYMIETKAANEMTNEEVLMKKQAAEEYCRNATEYNLGNDGKAWKYVLIPHDKINKASNFSFLVATN